MTGRERIGPHHLSGANDGDGNDLAFLDKLRDEGSVTWSDRHGWMVLGHREALEVLHDHETFSNRVSRHLSVPNGFDPPEHTRYRDLIDPFFDEGPVAMFRPRCIEIAGDLIDSLPRGTDIDVVSDVGEPLAVRVQTAFMGWPDHFRDRLRDWARANHEATRSGDRDAAAAVAADFTEQVTEVLENRRSLGEDIPEDPTTELMRARIDGRPLSDEEIVSIVRNWTMGEVGTISASVGIVIHFLATYPDLQDSLRANPGDIPLAVDEMLRIHGPLMSNRRVATAACELGGQRISEGDRLAIFWPSVNRDEKVFDDPDGYRPVENAAANLLYGSGIHVCPGAPLARLQLGIFTDELLRRTNTVELSARLPERATYPAGGFSALWACIH